MAFREPPKRSRTFGCPRNGICWEGADDGLHGSNAFCRIRIQRDKWQGRREARGHHLQVDPQMRQIAQAGFASLT
jgi:hypothetical protein